MTITDALIAYGLFVAKSLTLVAALGLLAALLFRARRGGSGDDDEDGHRLEVVDLNHRFEQMTDAIKAASLPPKLYKKGLKVERKAEKAKAKAEQIDKRRVFVVDFHGDLMATEVGALREVVSALLTAASDRDEVLVRLENAGGAVHEHGLAAAQLLRLRRAGIPLTVAVDKVAASGGYLMACVANRILAAPFAVIGSIGVLAELPNFHRLLQEKGVDFELHTAGEHKRTLTLFGENTEEGRAKLREQLEDTHGQFKVFISRYRESLDLGRVATGEYWHGEQALELGLIDAVQTSDDYLLAARAEADLFKVRYRARKRPLERLLGSFGLIASPAHLTLSGPIRAVTRRVGRWLKGAALH
ncbi:protease SohB [Halochromatium glycolicum]|uniref:Protease SohB n=1 Tax=Halochromatium glycolicum TaxID=85075 RepID=A0AAJ0U3N1_9GAMM|nr:protease SohB [Halochromatium glycolicum]MBK1704681.1 protease SohB [Halochromatium glycolicum]